MICRIANLELRLAAGLILATGGLVAPAWAADKPPARIVTEANKALVAGEVDKALDGYKQAEQVLPESPELAFNQGVAYYRKGDFSKASEMFTQALATRDLSLESKAKFNLGNCAYSSALAIHDDLPKAMEKLQSAISHYRDAIDANPGDRDARANIETAQLLMKDLADRKKREEEKKKEEEKNKPQSQPSSQPESRPSSQPENPPQSRPESQPAGQQDQKKDQQGQDGKKDQQGQEKQGEEKEGQKSEEQKKQEAQEAEARKGEKDKNQDKEKKEEQAAQAVPATQRALTREEAERLLQLIRDKERQRREEQARRIQGRPAPVDKDW